MTDVLKISFVVPVYNNSACLADIVNLAIEATKKEYVFPEIIFVNDGSTDNSYEIIQQLAEQHRGFVYGIDLMRNYGQHHATLCGIESATGDCIITLDDDLAHSPEQGMQLMKYMLENKLDLAYGIPEKRSYSLSRSIGRYLLYVGSSIGTKRIAGASFRAMTSTLAKQLKPEGDVIFMDDLLTTITDRYHYQLFPNYRISSRSRYNNASLWKMGMNISFFYSGFPLRVMTGMGLFGSVISTMIGLFYLYKKSFFKVPMGYTSIIVAVLFSASAILLGIGVLGKYLYRIHGNQNRAQSYHIRKTTMDV